MAGLSFNLTSLRLCPIARSSAMRFAKRNLYYLRISSTIVLPLYLYLDEKHVDWMSDRVLQHVLADLRNRIPEKLTSEADAQLGPGGPATAKKGTLDVHRGDTYQFGYFLRKSEAHAVVIKTRRFVPAPPQPRPPQPSAQPSLAGKRQHAPRKRGNASKSVSKKRKTKGGSRVMGFESEEEIIDISSDDDEGGDIGTLTPTTLRRSARRRKVVVGDYEEAKDGIIISSDAEITNDTDNQVAEEPFGDFPFAVTGGLVTMDTDDDRTAMAATVKTEEAEIQMNRNYSGDPLHNVTPGDNVVVPLELDAKEEKPKLTPKLKYQGFNIHGKCICIIVEPYPPMRTTRTASLPPTGVVAPRGLSIPPPDYLTASVSAQRIRRARTPLFLPEDDRDRSVTPALWGREELVVPPVPLFSAVSAEEDTRTSEDGGMFELSQILQSVGGHPAGAAEDDDEIDGAALFGDADEVRGL